MTDTRILVIGAGPAGLRSSLELAQAGHDVVLAERSLRIGGAVYPQPTKTCIGTDFSYKQGRKLVDAALSRSDRIDMRLGTSFVGMDVEGNIALTGARGEIFKPMAVIQATGAREVVQPRPGWTLPGVSTVGAFQVALKTSGKPPSGRVAIAGSGPLLYALGAQLVRAGLPPVAVIDAARPARRPLQLTRLPIAILREAAGYMLTLVRARVPIFHGTHVTDIAMSGAGLTLTLDRSGVVRRISAASVALHDGLAPNDYGSMKNAPYPVVSAGDCREVLGRHGAENDGRRAAAEVLASLGYAPTGAADGHLRRHRSAQAALARLFEHDGRSKLGDLPFDTVICRCENRCRSDLSGIPPAERTPRLLRLTGRFGMGACQGRGCLDWVAALTSLESGAAPSMPALRGSRWPVAPVSISDLLAAEACFEHPETLKNEETQA